MINNTTLVILAATLWQINPFISLFLFFSFFIFNRNFNWLLLFLAFLLYIAFSTTNFEQENCQIEGPLVISEKLVFKEETTSFVTKVDSCRYKVRMIGNYEGTLEYGDYIIFDDFEKKPIENYYNNPQSFDYEKYMYATKINYQINIQQFEIKKAKKNSLYYWIQNLRLSLLEKNKLLYPEISSYINALVLGEKQFDDEVLNNYSSIGILHMLTISGAHLSFIIFFIRWVGTSFNVRLKKIDFFLLVFLPFYSIIAGFGIPILRATLVEVTFILFREKYSKKQLLAFYFCLFLLYNPFLIFSVSFVLTFYMSFVIQYLERVLQLFGPEHVKVKTSLLLFIFFIPFFSHLSSTINFFQPLSIVILTPLFTLVLLPLSFLLTFFPLDFVAVIYNLIVFWSESFSSFFSKFSIPFNLSGFQNIGFFGFFYFVLKFFETLNVKYFKFLLLLFLFFLPGYSIFGQVSFIDIGQGDSTLITTPIFNKNILIDTGPPDSYPELVKFLNYRNVHKLDYIIISHWHMDHYGNIDSLADDFNAQTFYSPLSAHEKAETYDTHSLTAPGALNIGGLELNMLSPLIVDGDNTNNESLVFHLTLGGKKFLFMGDAEEDVEQQLLTHPQIQNIDFLKVGHHGSQTSSTDEFIAHTNPTYSIIPFGKNNMFGHPHPRVIETLRTAGSNIHGLGELGSLEYWYFLKFGGIIR